MTSDERTNRTVPRGRARGSKDWAPLFLAELERTGMVSEAAKGAGVGRRTAYDRRERDEAFRVEWDEIVDRATDILERALYGRATLGVERPVFQGGELVGKVREYSDSLGMFLLKARRPETYRENHRVEHVGPGGGPLSAEVKLDDAAREAIAGALRQRPAGRPD